MDSKLQQVEAVVQERWARAEELQRTNDAVLERRRVVLSTHSTSLGLETARKRQQLSQLTCQLLELKKKKNKINNKSNKSSSWSPATVSTTSAPNSSPSHPWQPHHKRQLQQAIQQYKDTIQREQVLSQAFWSELQHQMLTLQQRKETRQLAKREELECMRCEVAELRVCLAQLQQQHAKDQNEMAQSKRCLEDMRRKHKCLESRLHDQSARKRKMEHPQMVPSTSFSSIAATSSADGIQLATHLERQVDQLLEELDELVPITFPNNQ